ncbi:hypothetical protein [Streptomyces sp. NBC_01294]|uniref:hypothetical protein n=1 Tax=Streptomyces sp. NBC_01294 TaxID=2903815 RepID=UPI002DDA8ED7|nr:hypothetical protein [Streptomyces sp. NBC_01294]WRZ56548.1 hypothetical protein OG534_08685 [Streptomyces sp. NBC_01294]
MTLLRALSGEFSWVGHRSLLVEAVANLFREAELQPLTPTLVISAAAASRRRWCSSAFRSFARRLPDIVRA